MERLLVFREHLKRFYGKYECYLTPLFKFILALTAFQLINANVGYMESLNFIVAAIVAALCCSVLPWNTIPLLAGAQLLAHFYELSVELAVLTAVLFLLMFLLYFCFSPKDTWVLVLMPVLFVLKVPYLMPVVLGLVSVPTSIVSISFGTIIYYLITYVKLNASVLKTPAPDEMLQKFTSIIDHLVHNNEMYLMITAFAATMLLVYAVRRMSVDYAWKIAIAAGSFTNIIILLIGDYMLDVSNDIIPLLIGTVISAAVGYILQFFIFNIDYSRTEYVRFEDDEYYYYVKAVPKISITAPEKKIKKINTQKNIKRSVGLSRTDEIELDEEHYR